MSSIASYNGSIASYDVASDICPALGGGGPGGGGDGGGNQLNKFLVAGAFIIGMGAGVIFDTAVDLEPNNVVGICHQGLTLVRFSAQPEPLLLLTP